MVTRNLANFILIFKTLQPIGQHTIFRTLIEHLIMPGKIVSYAVICYTQHMVSCKCPHFIKGIIRQILMDPKYKIH